VYVEKNIKAHSSVITKLECDTSNKFIISVTSSGEIIFWEYFNNNLEAINKYFDQNHSEVLDIYIDSKMLIAACSFRNGYILIFNITNGELISKINHPQNYQVNKALLAFNPMPLVVFHSQKDDILYCYTINGQYLSHSRLSGEFLEPLITRDDFFCNT